MIHTKMNLPGGIFFLFLFVLAFYSEKILF